MDGEIRAFCGVGPATEAEIKEEQEDEDNDASEDDEEEEEKSRNDRRNKGGRRNRNNKGNKGRGGRGNRGGQDEDEPAVLGEDFDMPKDFKPDEHHDMPKDMKMPEMLKEGEGENYDPSEFEFDANKEPDFSDEKFDFNDEANYEDDGEGGRRLRAGRGKRGRRAQKGSWKKQMRSRGNKGKNARRGGRAKKCKRCGKVSKKSLAKKRMSKGLFGILDANHNKNISLKEMFRPFSMADKDFDYNVSFAEFNQFISKAKKPICKRYIRKARKTAIKTWYEMGVPAAERKGKN